MVERKFVTAFPLSADGARQLQIALAERIRLCVYRERNGTDVDYWREQRAECESLLVKLDEQYGVSR